MKIILQYEHCNPKKTGSVVWSGSMDIDEERRTSSANVWKENV